MHNDQVPSKGLKRKSKVQINEGMPQKVLEQILNEENFSQSNLRKQLLTAVFIVRFCCQICLSALQF